MQQIITEAGPQAAAGQARNDTNDHISAPFSDPKAYLNDVRFNQKFTLPPGPGRAEPFHVTYSDYGYRNHEEPERENVILFCGPLFCSRLIHVAKDELAKKHRIRIINPDRPGIGGTTEVDAHLRLQVWLEIVPALLQHLNIAHVSLVCQSAGTLYALHTLLHLRQLLRPDRPYVAFCGPWVHPVHSGVSLMSLSRALPVAVLRQYDSVVKFFFKNVVPVAVVSSVLTSKIAWPWTKTEQTIPEDADAQMMEFEESLQRHVAERVLAENARGMSEEILLLLRKPGAGPSGSDLAWGTWGDFDQYVPLLAACEKEYVASNPPTSSTPHTQLEIEIFFAESDNMIGDTTGPQWLENCWRREQRGDMIGYQSHVVKGTDHDTILDLRYGVVEKLFRKISGESVDNQ